MNILCFFSGAFLGSLIGTIVLCCFQVNTINEYEKEIRELKGKNKE